MEDPEKIADFIVSHLNLEVSQAQELLETTSQNTFLRMVYQLLHKEVEVAEMQEKFVAMLVNQ